MCRNIFVAFLALALLIVAVCVFLLTRRPHLVATPTVTRSAVAGAEARLHAALSPSAAPSNSVDRIQASSPTSPSVTGGSSKTVHGGEESIHVSEDDVNVLLAGSKQVKADLSQAGVTDAQVVFDSPDKVSGTGVIDRNGAQQSITVNGVLIADGSGGALFQPQEVKIGMLPIPESTVDSLIKRESNRLLQAGLPRLPIRVETIAIHDHQLVLAGPARVN